MLLRSVLVRFYKSFNYDYLRKSDSAVSQKQPWEYYEEKWFPHVRIPIERSITTIVGENESGKSCLLTAIGNGVSGTKIHPKDFCRHSEFFTVEEGKRECPTGSRKSAATVNTSYPTFCISAMLSSSRSRCAFSIQRCS